MTDENTTPTFDDMRESLLEVKYQPGSDEAKEIIRDIGKAERMAEIEAEHFRAVIDECTAKLKGDELDKPSTVTIVEPVVLAKVNVPEANVVYACSQGMQDAAIQGLNSMPTDVNVEQAINAIYNAWVHGGFVKHYD